MERIIAAADIFYSPRVEAKPIQTEIIRKAIHLLVALVPVIAAFNLYLAVGLLAGGTLLYVFAEKSRREGYSILFVSDLTVVASRDRDKGHFVMGPVTLGVGAMLALLLYPQAASAIAIYSLAFGDSVASLVGKSVRSIRIPLTGGKTLAGSLACFAVVSAVSYRLTGDLPASLIIGVSASVFEALSFTDLDNIVLPVGTGLVATQILTL